MKNKPKQTKVIAYDQKLNFQLTWEKITDIETSLRRVAAQRVGLTFNHDNIEVLLKFTKQVIRIIETLKSQQKYYRDIQQNYNMIQSKLNNHDSIVNSLEQHHMQRLKALSDQMKNSKQYYEKAKKSLQQSQQQARVQFESIKKQNNELKYKIQVLLKQKEHLQSQIKEKDIIIEQYRENTKRFSDVTASFNQSPPRPDNTSLQQILCSSLAFRITSYLLPNQYATIELLNKKCRIYLTKSKKVQHSIYRSIIKSKDRTISYYHKHINYFEKLYHKIPEEILQSSFYRYEILKESIGTEFLNVLNSSAMLFEGKFVDIDDEQFRQKKQEENNHKAKSVVLGGKTLDIENQIKSVIDFNSENPYNILEIDDQIVRQFLEDRRNSRQKVNREITTMYNKIKTTAQIYSIDVESIGKFITNVLINFSKVFVLSKNLYAEARNLQSLNTLILRELANWDKIQVDKNSQIEDLKAQLQAQKKLKIFFTNESIKSQQRALAEENIKLSIQSKFQKQAEKLDLICREKEQLSIKLAELQKEVKNLKNDNKEIRRAYQHGKQKYNKILEELSVVKETILRMNIV